MNKILLIGINARYSHPAMALYYLREYSRGLPWEAVISEFTIRTPVDDILRCIEKEKPICAAFSVYIWNSRIIREILQRIESMRGRPAIVLGGPDAGYNPDWWLAQFASIDYIIAGHGEEAFRMLLAQELNSNRRFISIENPSFSQIPFPYKEEDLRGFAQRYVYYETSRGCPFRCAYCISSHSDQRLEFRDIDQVKDELERIMRHRPAIIKFVDRTFNAKKSHSHAVWEHLIDFYSGAGTRFHFEIHPALLDEDDFRLLAQCRPGLFQFEIGIQSTCGEALRAVNRIGEWKMIKPCITRLINMGTIPVHVDLIAGLPYEDYNALAFSFNEAYSLAANRFQLGYLKALPGTAIREQAIEWELKYAADPPYEVTQNKWLSAEAMTKIRTISRLVDALYNSHRFKKTLENLLPLYASQFNLFEELAQHALSKKAETKAITWDRAARLVADCTSGIAGSAFVLDCLRWDWCASFRTHRYPRMLKSNAMRKKRKELLMRLEEGWRPVSAEPLNEAIARRSNIFVPESVEFRAKYLAGKACAVFLPDAEEPLLLDC